MRTLQYLARKYWFIDKFRVIQIILLFATVAILQVISPIYVGSFFDLIVNSSKNTDQLFLAAGTFFGIVIMQQIFTFILNITGAKIGWKATNLLRSDLIKHAFNLDFNSIYTKSGGEFVERLDSDTGLLSRFFSTTIISITINILFIFAITIYSSFTNLVFGICLFLFAVFTLIALRAVQKDTSNDWEQALNQSTTYFSRLSEFIDGASVIRSFDAKKYVNNRLDEVTKNWFSHQRKASLAAYSSENIMIGAVSLASVTLMIFGYVSYTQKSLPIGSIFTFYYYLTLLQRPLYLLHEEIKNLQKAGGAATRIHNFLTLPTPLIFGEEEFSKNTNLDIEFTDVSFSYLNAQLPALKNVSLSFKEGQITGVYGKTGCGKSTLAKLIARLFDPTTGKIFIGEIELLRIKKTELRKYILYVNQDMVTFPYSIRQNLSLFDESVSDLVILDAIKMVGLEQWFSKSPHGLDSVLTTDYQISRGENQLLNIARVLVKNPKMIIFDEITSNLDAYFENKIIQIILNLRNMGTTVIIITHRFAFLNCLENLVIIKDQKVISFHDRRLFPTLSEMQENFLLEVE